MHIAEYDPLPVLNTVVKKILVYEKETMFDQHTQMPFFADGCPGVIFQQSAQPMFLKEDSFKLSSFFLYGQTVKPVTFLATDNFRMIVFIFFPSAIPLIFGLRSGEIRDKCVDLTLLPIADKQFSLDQLQHTMDNQVIISLISRYLVAHMHANTFQQDGIIQFALEHIIQSKGLTSLQELKNKLFLTERTFERKFEHHVGVSAKMFSRICQFRSSLHQLEKGKYDKLSDIAYNNGYSDQPHFIRSFKEFTGVNPLTYIRETQS